MLLMQLNMLNSHGYASLQRPAITARVVGNPTRPPAAAF
jgi:hypothetical protein